MKNGDISNRQCPILAFNLDNLLFRERTAEETKLRNKLEELLHRVTKDDKALFMNRPLNEKFITVLEETWHRYDYSIYLVTFQEEFEDDLHALLLKHNIPYTNIAVVDEWEELRRRVHNQYTYYFDTDTELLSYLSSKNALYIDRLKEVIR